MTMTLFGMQVVLASAFIPVFSGWLPPRYRGIRVIGIGRIMYFVQYINTQTFLLFPKVEDVFLSAKMYDILLFEIMKTFKR